MSRLIVLSNRVKLPDSEPMAGGLAVALDNVVVDRAVVWMGWSGEVDNKAEGFMTQSTQLHHHKSASPICLTYMTTALTPDQYQHYYCGFANSVLWPLMHEQPKFITQSSKDYQEYQAVSRLFAEQLARIIQPDDVIWVHDYHFLSMAYHCRALGIHNRIGLFLHIPFAPLSHWRLLNQSAELMTHLGDYDVIGTQTEQDCDHATAAIQHYLQDYDSQYQGSKARSLTIKAYPIGINTAKIKEQIKPLIANSSAKDLQPVKSPAQQIIAVDRIDYSKGLLARFDAYRDFLQRYPRYQSKLTFLQIACPSRLDLPVYQRLYSEVQKTVNDINQQFLSAPIYSANKKSADQSWQAISYSETVRSHHQLMKLFYQSDVGWVNSFKDGMNLVAKEYIAAQNPDDPGVLLLSQYAGAAEQMQAAVIIDPHEPASVIEGLSAALTMPLAERKNRYQELIQGLYDQDIFEWQQQFLEDLQGDEEPSGAAI